MEVLPDESRPGHERIILADFHPDCHFPSLEDLSVLLRELEQFVASLLLRRALLFLQIEKLTRVVEVFFQVFRPATYEIHIWRLLRLSAIQSRQCLLTSFSISGTEEWHKTQAKQVRRRQLR